MSFPLPRGVCRPVCRPRRANAFTRTEVVTRMALAAVRRGEDACAIVDSVANAVGCSPIACEVEAESFSIALALVEEAAGRALDAAIDLADEFSWRRGAALRPEGESSWWADLLAQLNLAARIIRITIAVYALLEAMFDFLDRSFIAFRDGRALLACLERRRIP